MNKKIAKSALASLLAVLVIGTTPAFGSTASISNGDFQSGAEGATLIAGWEVVNSRIDLGVTQIEGCTIQDTSDYSALRNYTFEALEEYFSRTSILETIVDPDNGDTEAQYRNYKDVNDAPLLVAGYPVGRQRVVDINDSDVIISEQLFLELTSVNPRQRILEEDWTPAQRLAARALVPDPATDNDSRNLTFDSTPDFEVELRSNSDVNAPNYLADFAWGSQFVEMYSDMNATSGAGSEGYVVHGPAIYSDVFTAKTIDDLSFKFAASDQDDDFKVFGYLLNTVTCAQTEIIDSTGKSSSWQTVTTAVPANGTYRFVFVAGTYDKTWGRIAGARMFVDDVVLSPNQERVALELAATGANVEWLFVAGLTAVIAGAGFLTVSRRKRTS